MIIYIYMCVLKYVIYSYTLKHLILFFMHDIFFYHPTGWIKYHNGIDPFIISIIDGVCCKSLTQTNYFLIVQQGPFYSQAKQGTILLGQSLTITCNHCIVKNRHCILLMEDIQKHNHQKKGRDTRQSKIHGINLTYSNPPKLMLAPCQIHHVDIFGSAIHSASDWTWVQRENNPPIANKASTCQ